MNAIAVIDMAACLAVLGAIIVLLIKMKSARLWGHREFLIFVLLVSTALFFLFLSFEWLWSHPIFGQTENFIGVLLPVFWGYAFYGIQQEKRKSDLGQSEKMHRQFIKNLPIGLCRTSIEDGGRFILANTAMARMMGYESVEQLKESTVSDLYKTPEDRNRMLAMLLAHDRVDNLEMEGKKRDGAEMFVSMSMRLNRDKDGNPMEILGTLEDITARKKAELALRKREQLHRQAQRSAKLGHWEYSSAMANPIWSKEMCRIFEFDREGRDGSFESLLERMHPDDRNSFKAMVADAIDSGAEINAFQRLLFPDERIKYVHVRGHADVDDNGEPIGIVGTTQDVTQLKESEIEREKTEHKLLQAQKLEAIGTLAGGIAHDFNNILSSIIGFTELSLNELPPDSPTVKKLQTVLQSGMRARDLVTNILAFSRESERTCKPVQVSIIIKECIKLLRASIPANIDIVPQIESQCGRVLADPIQIHQVVMNLGTNAYQAIGAKGGKITIEMAEVEIRPNDIQAGFDARPGAHVHLTVGDTGQGIDRQTQDMIFDPYFTTKKRGEGTGLGLSVVHGIVKKLHGQISVYSEPGQGTVFHVFLPCSTSEEIDDATDSDAPIVGGNEHVVVVDDEQPIVAMLTELLTGLGYRVTPFTSSEAALSFITGRSDSVDLLVTDMNMPQMCGDELSRHVLALFPELPVIICTGFSDTLDEKKAKALGIREFLPKPVTERRIAGCIRSILDPN